uniref:Uncharacterized protein n=1 Tax=Anguilla anguilla TaxID=7936 RepID=A0A0E9SF01_ANGAN
MLLDLYITILFYVSDVLDVCFSCIYYMFMVVVKQCWIF